MITVSGFPSGMPSGPTSRVMSKAILGVGRSSSPNVMLMPPRLFFPVMFQSPYTQNSPKLFWNAVAVGFGIVTNWLSRLSQKSIPYLSGRRVALSASILLLLFGTDKNPSLPTSRAENNWVGGLLSFPRMSGVTVLLEEMTMMLAGASSSVWKRLLGDEAVLNSATRPLREMISPTFTDFRTVAELEKTNKPFDARKSSDLSPAM